MSTTTHGSYITTEAGVDLHLKQYYLAKLDTSGNAVLAAAASDDIVGVLDEVPQKDTGACSIAHVSGDGLGKVLAGNTISKGNFITADSTGRAVAATQTAGGSQPSVRVFGRALEAATVGGEFAYEKMYFLY